METIYLKIKVRASNKTLEAIRNQGLFFSNIAKAISIDIKDIKEIEIMPNSKEICNECGKKVTFNSGLFVNRVADFNSVKTRIEMGKPYPKGNFICVTCNEK